MAQGLISVTIASTLGITFSALFVGANWSLSSICRTITPASPATVTTTTPDSRSERTVANFYIL